MRPRCEAARFSMHLTHPMSPLLKVFAVARGEGGVLGGSHSISLYVPCRNESARCESRGLHVRWFGIASVVLPWWEGHFQLSNHAP